MNLWSWLISPDGLPVLVALIGIVSGVIGGGVSQVIAGIFKTRGDSRQIKAASEVAKAAEVRWEREQAFEREKLRHASLREACIRYQNQVDELIPLYWDLQKERAEISEDDLERGWKALHKVSSEIALLVPILRVPIGEFQRELKRLDLVGRTSAAWPIPEESFDFLIGNIEDERVFLLECMTVALGTYDVGKNTEIERELKSLYDKRALDMAQDDAHNQSRPDEAPENEDHQVTT